MIVFWIAGVTNMTCLSRKARGARVMPAAAYSHRAPMEFTMHEVLLTNWEKLPRKKVLRLFTLFDDSSMPPRLVREDYSLRDLRELGARLPKTYIDMTGAIVSDTGEVIMRGPDNSSLDTEVSHGDTWQHRISNKNARRV